MAMGLEKWWSRMLWTPAYPISLLLRLSIVRLGQRGSTSTSWHTSELPHRKPSKANVRIPPRQDVDNSSYFLATMVWSARLVKSFSFSSSLKCFGCIGGARRLV